MSDTSQVVGRAAIVLEAQGDQFATDMRGHTQTVAQFTNEATQSATKSSAAFNTIGTAVSQSADKISTSQTRFLQSLDRQVAAMEGGKVAALALKAAQMGLSDSAAPLIERMREIEAAQRSGAAAAEIANTATTQLVETDAGAASRIKSMVAASLEKTAALNLEIEASLRAATAARELGDVSKTSSLSSISFAGQNRSLQETANQVNEVNAALAAIGRGASSTKDLQSQTDKLLTLWQQGRISADQYAAAVKQLDLTEVSLARSSQQASAKADEFIAKLKDQAATAGLTSKQLLEYRAAQLGVTDAAAPFIAKLENSEKAVHSFSMESGSARRELGVLARELSNGDFGAAGRSFSILAERTGLMSTLLSPAVLAVAALVVGIAALGVAAYQGSAEQTKFNSALVMTNNAAGETAEGLHQLAVNAAATGGSLSVAKDAVLELASSGKFTSEQISLISVVATEMEAVTGQAVKDTIKQFEELEKSPAQASATLNEQYHYLTQSVYDQIAALERQGDAQGAADLAEKTYADAMRQRTAEITNNVGLIEKAWRSAKNAVSSFWDEALNVGRTEQYDHDIAEYKKRLSIGFWTDEQRAEVMARIADLQKLSDAQKATARQKSYDDETSAASIEAARAIDKESESLDKNIRKKSELAKLSERFKAMNTEAQRTGDRNTRLDSVDFSEDGAPLSGGLYSQLQKDIEDKYKDKAKPKANENGIDAAMKVLQGQMQEQERALKQSQQNIKSQYDIGLLDTQDYLTAEYEARKAALAKEADIAQQEVDLASKKKNPVALEEAKNQQNKIRDEQLANEQKYVDDSQSLMAKNQRDVQAYIESLNASYTTRQQAIANLVSGAGLGDADKDQLNRLNQVQQEYDKAAESLRKSQEKGTAHGGISQSQYNDELAALQSNLQQRLDLETTYTENLKAVQADGWNGATRFMANYQRSADNVASHVETVFGTATKGMEDAFATFVTTGKLSFGGLATSIIADIARMQARAAISGLFSYAVSAVSSYFGAGSSGSTNGGTIDADARGSYAKGGAFVSGVQKFASGGAFTNGVVSSPTVAPMALFGEAGPEAIMPLTRAADGSLGVRSVGNTESGSAISISVQVNSDGSSSVQSPSDYSAFGKDLADFVDGRINKKITRATKDGGVLSTR